MIRMRQQQSRSIRARALGFSRGSAAGGQAGFSLVELLVTMIVLVVVLLAVYGVWSRIENTYAFTSDDMRSQEQARAAMGEMVEFIRTARQPNDVVNGVTVPENLRAVIVYAAPTELQMWVDTDRDANHTLELVRFRVSGGSLLRETAGPGYSWTTGTSVRLVTAFVTNDPSTAPLFTYAEAKGGSLPSSPSVEDPTRIREVTINLRIDLYTNQRPVAHELTSIVQPRNLREY
jgi:prepilin-type N-terminal cleavage/methylation domain-containing protein